MRIEDGGRPGAASGPGYAIGTVAGLTGLDPHTIRAWERRYGAVAPHRTPRGARRYADADVARLQLLKALVDAGEAIGGIATLGDEALRERLARLSGLSEGTPAAAGGGAPGLAFLAPGLEAQIEADPGALGRFAVTARVSDRGALVRALAEHPGCAAVIGLRELGPEPARAVAELAAASPRLVVVLYEFATAAQLARLARAGARLLREPIRLAQLRRAIEDFLAIDAAAPRRAPPAVAPAPAPEDVPERRFADAQLARLLETTGDVGCECPSHLASLVSSVLAFERYSHECESRGDEDAALHRQLALGAGQIRGRLEALLASVCRHEGIRV